MQATARRLSVVSATSCARRRLIRDVRPTSNVTRADTRMRNLIYFALIMGLFSSLFGGCRKQPSQPSASTPQTLPPGDIGYSQLDITERFDDHLRLKPEDWIQTIPLNQSVPNGRGLPPTTATADEIHKVGDEMSKIRESISIPNDGVYCPVCHIANTQLTKLRTPCPKCARPLLKFGWD